MTPEQLADLVHLRRAGDVIDRRYALPLDVPAVAPRAATLALRSPARFSRNFRATYGETPHASPMTRGMERAKVFLRQGLSEPRVGAAS